MLDLKLVSEREPDGSWEDCTWATGVMLANWMVGENRYPATRAEYEGLRFDATGIREARGDGSNYTELATGLLTRYNIAPVRMGTGWAAALEAAPVGQALALQGLYGKLPSRLRITGFTGGHSVLWIRDQADSGLLYDPLALAGSAPRRATNAEMKAYFEGLSGARWIAAREREAWRDPMIRFNLERWSVPAGTPVFENPGGAQVTKYSKAATVTTIGPPIDRSADKTDWAWRAALVTTGAIDGQMVMKVGFIPRASLTPLATAAEWDAAVLQALTDPSFRGGSVVHADDAEIAAAKKAGIIEGLKRAETFADAEAAKLGG